MVALFRLVSLACSLLSLLKLSHPLYSIIILNVILAIPAWLLRKYIAGSHDGVVEIKLGSRILFMRT
jgi:hypothetical protein